MNEYAITFNDGDIRMVQAANAEDLSKILKKMGDLEILSISLAKRGVVPHDLTSGMCET